MRHTERLAIWAGVIGAVAISLGLRMPEARVIAQPSSQTIRVGSVDMFLLLEGLIESDRYKPARDARDAEIKVKYDAIMAELKQLETKIQLIPQGTPEYNTTMQQGQAKEVELRQFTQQVSREQDAFVAAQVKEAYGVVHQAANAVADRLGYTHLIATRLDAATMKGESLAPAMQEILARPLVRGSSSDDITAQVRTELKLPEKTPEPVPAPAVPTPTTPPGGG
jgi:hypothetical protein